MEDPKIPWTIADLSSIPSAKMGVVYHVMGTPFDLFNPTGAVIGGLLSFTSFGKRVGAIVLCRDATELRKQERELITKDATIREIHHRVKNNLQIITSLLRLQSRELENPEAIAKFKDATHRVIAMSMIHEKMYQSDHLSTLHLREYLLLPTLWQVL